jgi:phosphoserine phosphatase
MAIPGGCVVEGCVVEAWRNRKCRFNMRHRMTSLQGNDRAGPGQGSAFDLPLSMPLAVDLDGTLIDGDMLDVSIRAAFRRNPFTALWSALQFMRGRAALKRAFARGCRVDTDRIKLHEDVLALVRREKAAGRLVVLATASDILLAEQIAMHLRIFDRVLASDGTVNLKGEVKAQALARLFPDGFIYAGDSRADLPVWQRARAIVVVDADKSVVEAARALGKPILELSVRTGL